MVNDLHLFSLTRIANLECKFKLFHDRVRSCDPNFGHNPLFADPYIKKH